MSVLLVLSVIILVLNIFFSLSLIFIEKKDPHSTWAWLLILLVLPGLGFVIYIMFGQNLSRQKIFKEKIRVDEDKRRSINDKYEGDIHHHDGGERF